jgi:hypothetical protein
MPADTSIYRNKLTPEQKESLIADYLGGMTCEEVGQRYGVKQCSAWELLKRRGLTRPAKVERRYTLNESAFDSITPESAYWAGMLMADGCVSIRPEGSQYLILSLQESDAGHVQQFLSFLGSDQPVTHERKSKMASVQVSSHRLVASVREFGITPRKSQTAKVCDQLRYNTDFWRGYIDGNGSVSITGTGYPFVSVCTGSARLVGQYWEWVKRVVPDYTAKPSFNRNTHMLVVFGKQTFGFIELLYGSCAVALERKRAAALNILQRAKDDPIWCRRSWRTADREFREAIRLQPTPPLPRHS